MDAKGKGEHNPNFDFLHLNKTYVVEQHDKSGMILQQVLVHGCAGPVDAMLKAKLDETSQWKLGHKPITVHAYPFIMGDAQHGDAMGFEERHGLPPPIEEKDTV